MLMRQRISMPYVLEQERLADDSHHKAA